MQCFLKNVNPKTLQNLQIKIKSNKFYYIFIKVDNFVIKSMTMTRDLIYKHKIIEIMLTIFCMFQSHCNQTIKYNISYSQLKNACPSKEQGVHATVWLLSI